MDRRTFLHTSSIVSAAGLAAWDARPVSSAENTDRSARPRNVIDTVHTWHFLDLWRFDHFDQLTLRQGQPKWQADAIYSEPHVGSLSA